MLVDDLSQASQVPALHEFVTATTRTACVIQFLEGASPSPTRRHQKQLGPYHH